jgi:hypothetical protein
MPPTGGAGALPPTYVFEDLRGVLLDHVLRADLMLKGLAINSLPFAATAVGGSGPDRFLTISFLRARFYGEAIFSGRTFEEAAEFTEARFCYPPDFDAATNAARIDFTGANIGFVPPGRRLHWTSDTKVPLRLRTFRKIADDTKNHNLERDLYIEERGRPWHGGSLGATFGARRPA